MKVKPVDVFFSIGLGLLAIYATHSFLVIDACLDMGGAIDEATGSCFNENYHEQYMVFSPVLLVIDWINRAKREETKLKRLDQMLAELEKGGVYMKMSHPASNKK